MRQKVLVSHSTGILGYWVKRTIVLDFSKKGLQALCNIQGIVMMAKCHLLSSNGHHQTSKHKYFKFQSLLMLNEFDHWWPAISLAILASQRLQASSAALTRSEVIYYSFFVP